MPALDYPPPLQRLIAQVRALPGLGPRSAERVVLWLLQGGGRVEPLVDALQHLADRVRPLGYLRLRLERNRWRSKTTMSAAMADRAERFSASWNDR